MSRVALSGRTAPSSFAISDVSHVRNSASFGDPASPKNALLIEAGQHWEKSSVDVAIDTTLRFLQATGLYEFHASWTPPGDRNPSALPTQQLFVDKPPADAKQEGIFTLKFDEGKKEEEVTFLKAGSDAYGIRKGASGAAKLAGSTLDEILKALDALK